MQKLKIVSIKDNKYTFINEINKQQSDLVINFFELSELPAVNDTIFIHNELFDKSYEEFSTVYQFGPLNHNSGRKINSIDDIDCIVLVKNDKKTALKRLFG